MVQAILLYLPRHRPRPEAREYEGEAMLTKEELNEMRTRATCHANQDKGWFSLPLQNAHRVCAHIDAQAERIGVLEGLLRGLMGDSDLVLPWRENVHGGREDMHRAKYCVWCVQAQEQGHGENCVWAKAEEALGEET